MKKPLDEEKDKEIVESFYKDANEINTPSELADFITVLTNSYIHDYGTIVHAATSAAIAAVRVVDHDPDSGGITGFQAGCIMWQFVRKFLHMEGPMRLVEFKNMLYPQYEDEFSKKIDKKTWEWLQKKAKENLLVERETTMSNPDLFKHWKSIADGKVPFGYRVEEL
jgi:hypothetical protein